MASKKSNLVDLNRVPKGTWGNLVNLSLTAENREPGGKGSNLVDLTLKQNKKTRRASGELLCRPRNLILMTGGERGNLVDLTLKNNSMG